MKDEQNEKERLKKQKEKEEKERIEREKKKAKEKIVHPPYGIQNFGNTCYFNYSLLKI